jgi:hypothetical protein
MIFRYLLVSVFSLIVAAAPQAAPIEKQKEADIRRLFDLMNIRATTKTQLELASAGSAIVIISEAEKRSNLSDTQKKEIGQIVLDAHLALTERVIDLSVAAYDAAYSHSEIREMIAFYLTPVGLKSIRVGGELQQRMLMAYGVVFQKYAVPEIERKLSQISRGQSATTFPQPLAVSQIRFEPSMYSGLATPYGIHLIDFRASNLSDTDFIEAEFRIVFYSPNGRELGEFCFSEPVRSFLKKATQQAFDFGGSVRRCNYVPPQLGEPKSPKDNFTDEERLIAFGSSKTLRIVPYLSSGTTANGERVTCSRVSCEIVK